MCMADCMQRHKLRQMGANDSFLRTDFNEDLLKIDTALAAVMNNLTFASYACSPATLHFTGLAPDNGHVFPDIRPNMAHTASQ